MSRVLILSASVGEGHDGPARTLTAQLRHERPDVEVVTADSLAAMGGIVAALSEGGAGIVFYRWRWVWDLGYWFFAVNALSRGVSQRLLLRFGSPGLLRLIREADPDVIVSVYPAATEVLGRLRRAGQLDIPVVAAITDLAAMHYWASAGVDVHLFTHPESLEEIVSVSGDGGVFACVHGFTTPDFRLPRPQPTARAELGLPPSGKVVLVSGGGWGVGDLESAVVESLALDEVSMVVCLCGRNDELRTRLSARFAGDVRVRVEGFTEVMSEWMAAADVLVHATGGLTVLEALMRGCPAISYGWGRGHVRLNNRAFRRFGLADVVDDRAGLAAALRRAFATPRVAPAFFADLPSAASYVLQAADAR